MSKSVETTPGESVTEAGYTEKPAGLLRTILDHLNCADLVRTPYGIWPLVLVAAVAFIAVGQLEVFRVAGPNIAQDVNLDLRTIGGLFAIVGVLSTVLSLTLGWLADRTRRTWMAAIGAGVTGIASMLQSRAVDTNSFAIPNVASETSAPMITVPVLPLLSDWYPPHTRGRVFAVVGALLTVGRLAGIVFVGAMVIHFGWRTTNVIIAAPLLVLALGFFLLKEPVRGYFEKKAMGLPEEAALREDPPQSFGEAWRTTWSVRTVRRLFVAAVLLNIGLYPFAIYLSFFLADQYNLDVGARTAFFLPTVVVSLVGAVIGGGLVDRLSRPGFNGVVRVVARFTAVAVVGAAGGALTPPLWLLSVLSCVVYFGFSLSGPGLSVIYSQVIPPNVRSQGQQVTNL